jgi:Lrp/AsnC family transcriptional regulator for asnA, asnC and gidA
MVAKTKLGEKTVTRDGKTKVDDLDVKIMNYLRQNGRVPSSHIAREIGIPEATIRYRLKRLRSKGFIVTLTMPNMDRVAPRVPVVFFVKTVPGDTMEFIETLKAMPAVRFLAIGSGHYDLFVSTAFESEDDYLDFRHRILGASSAVQNFELLQLVKVMSRTYDYTLSDDLPPAVEDDLSMVPPTEAVRYQAAPLQAKK